MTEGSRVRWPEFHHPRHSAIHVENVLDMEVGPEFVWAWLVRAPLWPSWYEKSSNVQILNGNRDDLEAGSRFRWKTMGNTIDCTVVECVAGERISWTGRVFGIDVCHAWVLEPSDNGCHVVTEETQRGLLAALGKPFLHKRMAVFHDLWLNALHQQARSGPPPPPAVSGFLR